MSPTQIDMTTTMVAKHLRRIVLAAVLLAAGSGATDVRAQFANKWLSAGTFHNWYSEVGSECEECGFIITQQSGWRWPGINAFTDMQAAKALWIGAANVTDDRGQAWSARVVHVGPRVRGSGEFFPTRFEMVSRFTPPLVTVDGDVSEPEASMSNDSVDPTIEADRIIINEANTLLGLTMERRILQFSQEFHDNYHVIEYTFTNTGNTDGDPEIELPTQTLHDIYVMLQWRLSIAKETRYVIGNGTGWGLNAMLDSRGDGVKADPPTQDFRAQMAWHGKFPPFTAYDNVGGPILRNVLPALQINAADTLGRLGASQFAGIVTLHADRSATDPSDDRSQPSMTSWLSSDEGFQSQNDAFNLPRMESEYNLMKSGHKSPRHVDVVEPSGMPGLLKPTGDPSLGTPGGFSNVNGYGPYTLAPGESFRFVIAEGAAGLSRAANEAIGRAYYLSRMNNDAQISYPVGGSPRSMTKNQWVYTGRDSLFQMFSRAQANFQSDYAIPKAPMPPSSFEISGGGDRILLRWEAFDDADHDGFEIYRARGRSDSLYTLIHTAGASERSYDDENPIRGIDYYYYIVSTKNGSGNPGGGGTPAGKTLRSSRYYTQSYGPTRLKRPAGSTLDQIRIVPNPYKISSNQNIRFPDQTDKLAFFDIPGQCRIEIYSELGELVDAIDHRDGSGDAFWDHTTSSRQVIVSGLYIAVITDLESGERAIKKFVIIR